MKIIHCFDGMSSVKDYEFYVSTVDEKVALEVSRTDDEKVFLFAEDTFLYSKEEVTEVIEEKEKTIDEQEGVIGQLSQRLKDMQGQMLVDLKKFQDLERDNKFLEKEIESLKQIVIEQDKWIAKDKEETKEYDGNLVSFAVRLDSVTSLKHLSLLAGMLGCLNIWTECDIVGNRVEVALKLNILDKARGRDDNMRKKCWNLLARLEKSTKK